MLKFLIGAASVMVIAVGGFWFWQQYQNGVEAQRHAEFASWRAKCIGFMETVSNNPRDEEAFVRLTNCLANGYVSQADLDAAISKKKGGS